MRIIFLFLICQLCLNEVWGQDTVFFAKHSFKTPVRNVFAANGEVYVKTGDALYQLNDEIWKDLEMTFKKPYVFFRNGLYESDFIPNTELFDIGPMKGLIPQRGEFIATAARLDDRLFVSTGSALFEYKILPYFRRTHHNRSIRDIYIEPGLKVVSTYSGIFVNDTIKLSYPTYSNGALAKIGDRYFLPWDDLSEFFPPDAVISIPQGSGPFPGKAREIISWKGNLYSMNTQSVSLVADQEFDLLPIHRGEEYLDIETLGEKGILFSTFSGKCFFWDGSDVELLAELPTKIRDIYVEGPQVFLCSDDGLYALNALESNSLQKLYSIPYVVAAQLDELGNLWISTENGLFVVDTEFSENPISVIPQVEFNREAILLDGQTLHVGAVDGLYHIDTYEIKKAFLPKVVSSVPILDFKSTFVRMVIAVALLILGLVAFLLWKKFHKAPTTEVLIGSKKEYTMEDFEHAISEKNLATVDALAEHFETNTVQLNRIFKSFDTTPGKFLKKVKLNNAKELTKQGTDWEEISKKTGYSVSFLRKHLNL